MAAPRRKSESAESRQEAPSASEPTRRLAVWLDTAQVPLARAVAELASARIVGAGSPTRGHSGAVADELACAVHDDLRAMLSTVEADAVLILAPGDLGSAGDNAYLGSVEVAAARGVKVASIEPIPSTVFGQSGAAKAGPEASGIAFIPRHRASAPFREAAEPLAQLEAPRTLSVEAWNVPGAGSLGAAMFSSMDLILSFMGEPRVIDAVYLPAAIGPSARGPESLRDLRGDLTAVLRFEDARAATLVLSDQGGRWNRSATFTSPQGRFRVFDDGFEWIGPDGRKLDELRPERARRGDPDPGHAQRAIARALSDLLDPSALVIPATQMDSVLVLCETALLSARTSQAESPETIRRMLEGGALG